MIFFVLATMVSLEKFWEHKVKSHVHHYHIDLGSLYLRLWHNTLVLFPSSFEKRKRRSYLRTRVLLTFKDKE